MQLMTRIGRVVALRDRRADRRVRTLDLVIDRLADVVQQPALLAVSMSAPVSPAMTPARRDVSIECLSTFWP
jgi:hypothetical protein